VLRRDSSRADWGIGIEGREMIEECGHGSGVDRILFRVPMFVSEFLQGVKEEIAGVGDDSGPARGDRILGQELHQAAENVIDGRSGTHVLDGPEQPVGDIELGAGASGAFPGFEELALLGDGVPMAEIGMSRRTNHAATAASVVGMFTTVFLCRL
jgi:hypothetical protein